MRLVKAVKVSNFRSLRAVSLGELEEYVVLIGPNGTGKSNVLRALSVFFNDYLDEALSPIDLARDFPDYLKNKKRQISVAVEFDLSTGYSVREFAKTLGTAGITNTLVIERTWSYFTGSYAIQDEYRFGASFDDLRNPDQPELAAVQGFVRSVQFRYIPNHVRPADLIQLELQPLRKTLVSRLKATAKYKKAGGKETLTALNEVAEDLFSSVSASVAKGTLQLKSLRPNLPGDFADLAFQVALDAVSQSDIRQSPELQGSGTQSFILLHVLALADRAERSLGFGWHKSSMWAIEEPESFLHAGLRARFASDLREFARDQWRQIFVTTHAEDFVRVSDTALLVTSPNGPTEVEVLPARDALLKSSKLRISAPIHPLLVYADIPIVLVEGLFDQVYLRRALEVAGRRLRWRLTEISEIDRDSGGGDAVIAFLSGNKQALRSRPDSAPVFVLRDWSDTRVGAINTALGSHPYSKGLVCPGSIANPELGESFRGIERYLTTSFVEKVAEPAVLQNASKAAKFPLEIRQRAPKNQVESMKQSLAKQFERTAQAPGAHLVALAEWLDDQVTLALDSIPAGAFIY